ncbi:MAG: hypothetical protein ABSA96_12755 [Candidatus Acidiferrales bacterium]
MATLGGPGDAPDVREPVIVWLRKKIEELEGTTAQPQQPAAWSKKQKAGS